MRTLATLALGMALMTGCTRYEYSEPIQTRARVTQKNIVPGSMYFMTVGDILIPVFHPNEYHINVRVHDCSTTVNNFALYEKYNVGDTAPVTYRNKYRLEGRAEAERVYDGCVIEQVE